MKTLKELEKEYNQYQIGENVIDNFEEFYAYLNDVINNVSKNWEDAFNQITENNRWQRISKIRNLLPFLFIQEDTTFYDYDNSILVEASDVFVHNLEYFERMNNIVSRDNFVELNKLLNFLLDYYEENINYLNFKREKLNAQYKGTSIVEPEYDYNFELIDKFANKKLSSFEHSKQLVKSK